MNMNVLYKAMYVDNSPMKMRAIQRRLAGAARDLKIECKDLGQAILRLKEDDPELDAVVAYLVGWESKQRDFERMIGFAEAKNIPVIYAIGNITVTKVSTPDERYLKAISFTDGLDLSIKVKDILDGKK